MPINWAAVRNVAIILALAAIVVAVPGGGTGAAVVTQAVSLLFLATLGWFASISYRQHRSTLYGLGERNRVIAYVAVGVLVLVLSATSRMWSSSAGSVAWLLLVGGAVYALVAVFLAYRRA